MISMEKWELQKQNGWLMKPWKLLFRNMSVGGIRLSGIFIRISAPVFFRWQIVSLKRCYRFILIVEMAIRKKIPGFSR